MKRYEIIQGATGAEMLDKLNDPERLRRSVVVACGVTHQGLWFTLVDNDPPYVAGNPNAD